MSDEVRILFYRRLSLPDVAYILARYVDDALQLMPLLNNMTRVASGGFLGASLTFLGMSYTRYR